MSTDFLATWDKSESEIRSVLDLAQKLRDRFYKGKPTKTFESGLAVSIFKDKSTRTRYSYSAAANLVGLEVEELDEGKSQITHGETVMETANMVSFLTRTIGIRDDIFLGVGHKFMEQMAAAVEWGHKNQVLRYRPTVINLQSDEDHPTQSMSDLLHLVNHFGGLEKLKGKKLAMSWAYSPSYGKPLSVPQGVIALLTRFGMDVTLAYPSGYQLIPRIEKTAKVNAAKSCGRFSISHDMAAAFRGADAVYPKSWAPYRVMEQRTKLLEKNDEAGLKELEKTALAENAKHRDWECGEKLMKLTNGGKGLYMHCLPADISGVNCRQGEVSAGVFEKYKKQTYLQASHKPFIIAAMMVNGQFGEKSINILS